jgi:hypothetical protein
VRSHWLPQPTEYVHDLMAGHQADAHAINAAVHELLDGHESPGGFHRRDYHRLHVGPYRVHCIIEDDVLNVTRVDKVLP